MWHSYNITVIKLTCAFYSYCIIIFFYLYAHFSELCSNRLKMLCNNILNKNIPTCRSCGSHICPSLYLVRNNRVCRAIKSFYTRNLNNICACTSNICTHRIKEICKVNYMWLFRSIFYYCFALCLNSSKHYIHSSSNRNNIHIDMVSYKLISFHTNHSAICYAIISTKSFKAFKMKVYWANTKIAATWHCNFSTIEFSK